MIISSRLYFPGFLKEKQTLIISKSGYSICPVYALSIRPVKVRK